MGYIIGMREVNLASLDLNLLVALKALLDERNVTRAAEIVGLSQPAMSRALQRLRIMFKDPLLVKGVGGMTLTARALSLSVPLQNILNDINQIVAEPALEPAQMRGEIVLATRDYEMAAILPDVIRKVISIAPGLNLRVQSLIGDDLSPLERNEVDFVIAGTDHNSASLRRKTLLKDNFVCVLSAKNPALKKKLTMEKYLSMRHCVTMITDYRSGIVDKHLADLGQSRNAVVKVPYFMLAASPIVANSDLIATVPRRLGVLLAEKKDLVLLDLPFKVRDFAIYLYWHVRNQSNPMHIWLRECFELEQ
ncbi:MAG: LysR family transcriptional regulator [Candidatus Obscuribacterales bacterium]|nr:LysR family transcriptional regulator [Candidatus Obscuribacterales bacterium]